MNKRHIYAKCAFQVCFQFSCAYKYRDLLSDLTLCHFLRFSCWIFFLPQAEWVALNYVPFAERSLEVLVDLYHKTACHKAVINEKVLQNIIKVCLFLVLGLGKFIKPYHLFKLLRERSFTEKTTTLHKKHGHIVEILSHMKHVTVNRNINKALSCCCRKYKRPEKMSIWLLCSHWNRCMTFKSDYNSNKATVLFCCRFFSTTLFTTLWRIITCIKLICETPQW